MKMLIGIDLDEVLADFMNRLIEFHNLKYGTKFAREDFRSYGLWKTWGGTSEEALMKLFEFYSSPYFHEILAVSGSQDGVNYLKRKHELIVITSRPQELKDGTLKWLDNFFPQKFSEPYFTEHSFGYAPGAKTTKATLCSELGIGLMLEDSLEYALECASQGTRVFLLDCPWNQAKKLPSNVARVYSWEEILKKSEHSNI